MANIEVKRNPAKPFRTCPVAALRPGTWIAWQDSWRRVVLVAAKQLGDCVVLTLGDAAGPLFSSRQSGISPALRVELAPTMLARQLAKRGDSEVANA